MKNYESDLFDIQPIVRVHTPDRNTPPQNTIYGQHTPLTASVFLK